MVQTELIMNSEPLRIYHPEKANMSQLDESKFVEEQLQNPSEELTQQDTTEAAAKPRGSVKACSSDYPKKEERKKNG